MSAIGKRLVSCLCLAGFGLGCGGENPSTSVPDATTEAGSASEVQSAEVLPTVGQVTAELSSPTSPTENLAVLPELIVPARTMIAMDAEVRPAAAVGFPAARFPASPADAGQTALANLVQAYRGGQPELWTRAESAIHAQGSAALPALLEGLNSQDRQTRELAAMMLAQVLPALLYPEDFSQKPETSLLAEKLRRALGDDSVEVRVNVAVALSMMDGQGPLLVPVFLELLGSELPHVRTMVVVALGGLGSPAASAIPAIERLSLSDPDPNVKAAALEALGQLRPLQ
jgi:HEAT repeat protein